MKLYSTNNRSKFVSLKEAVIKGLPEDSGLFMPSNIPLLSPSFIKNLSNLSFEDISFQISKALIGNSIPENDLRLIIDSSISFPAPVVKLNSRTNILELFHGPSLAFKDFGARFMAQLMGYFNIGENKDLTILVATSGDTGGAVASGFYNIPGINVIILYPSGKVSHLQELQLSTFDKNITAIELDGTFDDCQSLVKKAFLDFDLNTSFRLSSANSINIARLIPQTFYYFEAFKHVSNSNPVVFSIPSGNFGNLTAGLIAKRMGLPVFQFIAATNINDIFPKYLSSGIYHPKTSRQTISNAMDVGNPSNFDRILDLYGSTWNNIKNDVVGFSCSDKETEDCILRVFKKYNYILDPHGAIGYLAFEKYLGKYKKVNGIVFETAHPSKFNNILNPLLRTEVTIPKRLSNLIDKKKNSVKLPNNFDSLKSFLFKKLS